MVFLWPGLLIFLAAIPLLVVCYILVLRRGRRNTLRYSSLELVRLAKPGQSGLRKYLPPALFLLALTALVAALARPAVFSTLPTSQSTVILVMDVSGSMSATDISPTRLGAAEAAALSFVKDQKSATQIGIVAFSSAAQLVQSPTRDQAQLRSAIRSLTIGDSTAIGSGMLEALKAIAQLHGKVLPPVPQSIPDPNGNQPDPPGAPGPAYAPEIIVLLTDGSNNDGPIPTQVAYLAAEQGVRVYTIGYGPVAEAAVNKGKTSPVDPQALIPNTGSDPNQNGFNSLFLNYDAAVLAKIAKVTGGATFTASSASDLEKVFARLPIQMTLNTETHEVAVDFIAAAALLTMAALVLSALWHPLP